MCGRYTLRQNLAEICAAFGVSTALSELSPSYNSAPETPRAIIVRDRLGLAVWGWPVPDGVKPLINIRSESAHAKPMFHDAWQAGRRCIVPASGFYEWDGAGQPFFVHAPAAPLAGFAGLWTRDAGGGVRFAVLTRAAAAPIAAIHPRMPVMGTPACARAWLEGGPLPEPPVLAAYPVGRAVNATANDGPDLLDPLPAAPQGNLFAAQ